MNLHEKANIRVYINIIEYPCVASPSWIIHTITVNSLEAQDNRLQVCDIAEHAAKCVQKQPSKVFNAPVGQRHASSSYMLSAPCAGEQHHKLCSGFTDSGRRRAGTL